MPFEDDFDISPTDRIGNYHEPSRPVLNTVIPNEYGGDGTAKYTAAQVAAWDQKEKADAAGCAADFGDWKGPAGAKTVQELYEMANLDIPAVVPKPKPPGEACWEACKLRDIRRKEICVAMRERVLAYLEKEGCPSYVSAKKGKRYCYGPK